MPGIGIGALQPSRHDKCFLGLHAKWASGWTPRRRDRHGCTCRRERSASELCSTERKTDLRALSSVGGVLEEGLGSPR